MKKCNLSFYLLIVSMLFILNNSIAQNSDNMPVDVRARMDQNKLEGKPFMDGIYTQYEVLFWGADTEEKRFLLINRLQESIGAISVTFDPTTNHFSFVCSALVDKDIIKNSIIPEFEINNVYKESYILIP